MILFILLQAKDNMHMYKCFIHVICSSKHKISPMETTFEEMGYGNSSIQNCSATALQNCFTSRYQVPELDEEMVDESVGAEEDVSVDDEEELVDEKLSMDKVFAAEEVISLVAEEYYFDWDCEAYYSKRWVRWCSYAKDGCEAFGLKLWVKSAFMAAAVLSIFILGGARMQFTGNNKRIHAEANKKEEVKDQHQQAASSLSSLSGTVINGSDVIDFIGENHIVQV